MIVEIEFNSNMCNLRLKSLNDKWLCQLESSHETN